MKNVIGALRRLETRPTRCQETFPVNAALDALLQEKSPGTIRAYCCKSESSPEMNPKSAHESLFRLSHFDISSK